MKILHVIDGMDPVKGGPPMIATRIAAAQARLGHDVTFLTYASPDGAERTRRAVERIPSWEHVRLHEIESPPLSYARAWFSPWIEAEIDHHVREADMVHLHAVWETILIAAGRSARRHGRPYCILLNGMLDPWSMSQSRWKKRLAMLLGHRRHLNAAAFLHLGNREEQRLIAPLGLTAPTRIIPNGVFLEEIEPLPERGRFHARHLEVGGRPYILFLSRLHFKKGLDYLAMAFERLAHRREGVSLVVAGPDGGSRPDFERRISAAGLSQRVHVIGPLYGQEKLEALVDAICFCLPSRQEGFSIAILEALACGVPLVISEGCHFPEVGHAGAGHVVPLDAERISDALEQIVDAPTKARQMGQAGRDLVESRYTWDQVARASLDAYAQVIGGTNDAPEQKDK